MVRLGIAYGVPSVNAFCTPTGIFLTVSTEDEVVTELVAIDRRGTDLGRVAEINEVSRQVERGALSVDEAADLLEAIAAAPPPYPFWVHLLARGTSCAAWSLLLGGKAADFLPAMVAGFIVHLVVSGLSTRLPNFLAIYFGALVGALWAVLAVNLGVGSEVAALVVGVIIPLVPGMAMTNAVRDLIAGDLVAGVARGAEALLVAVAIASGVWSVLAASRFAVFL